MSVLSRAENALLARDPQLAALRLVFDDDALAAAVARLSPSSGEQLLAARPAVRRLRYKPGDSVLAAVEVPGLPSRWLLLAGYAPEGAAKLAKDARVGRAGTVVDENERWLLAPALSDRRIRAERLVRGRTVQTLAYNPRRRLVLRAAVGPGAHEPDRVLKVYARDTRRPSRRLLKDLAAAGVPLPTALTSPNRNLHVSAWMPGRHADPGRDGPVVRTALDRLHAAALPATVPTWDAAEVAARTMAAAESVTEVLPHLTVAAVDLARRIAERLARADLGPVGSLHGDFSPDQVLVTDDGATLVDLDDCSTGPLAWDAATWLAAQLSAGALDAVALPGIEPVPELSAAALALRAIEPFRRRQPAWELTTARLIARGHAVLDEQGTGMCRTKRSRIVRRSTARRPAARSGQSGVADLLPPLPVARSGEPYALRRAWPDGDRLVLELSTHTGEIVAASWRPGDALAQLVAPEHDRALPGLAAMVRADATLVGHRLGKRAVVRTEGGYAKAVRPSRTAGIAALHASVRTALATVPGAPDVPELSGVDESTGVLRLATLPGEPLEHAIRRWGLAEAAAAGRRLGASLRAFGAARVLGLPTHTASDEAQVLRGWQTRAYAFDVLAAADRAAFDVLVATALDRLDELARRTSGRPSGGLPHRRHGRLVHRDLHLGQVLATKSGLGVLDLDTAALGDPALDIGNLLAHVDLEVASGRCPLAVAVAFGGGALERLAVDGPAVAAYRLATRARLVAVHAFRPGAAQVVPALLALDVPRPSTIEDAGVERAAGAPTQTPDPPAFVTQPTPGSVGLG